MEPKKANSNRAFLLVLILIGAYLYFASVAFFRSKGGLPIALPIGALAALLGVTVIWVRIRPSNIFHWAGLSLLLASLGGMGWNVALEMKRNDEEKIHQQEFLKKMKIESMRIDWIRIEGFPSSVGIQLTVDLKVPEQSFAKTPRLTLVPEDGSSSPDFKNTVFFKTKEAKEAYPILKPGTNPLVFEIYPSFLTHIEGGKFCVNTTRSSLSSHQTFIPRMSDNPLVAAEWLLGNGANLGAHIEEEIRKTGGANPAQRIRDAANQFANLVESAQFQACQSIPKESSICYCLKGA